MEFIKATKLKNIFKWDDIVNQSDRAKDFFLNHNEEVIYVCKDNELKALVTPGDILRYYERNDTEFKPNTKFTYLQEIDFEEAKKITDRFITINEVPVVIRGKFDGIIKKKKQRNLEQWRAYKRNLLNIDEDYFFINAINVWKKYCDAEIFFYIIPNEIGKYLDDVKRMQYQQKANFIDSAQFDKDKEAKEKGFNLEFRKIKYNHKDGFFILEDLITDSLKIKNRHRITPNAQMNSKKIYILGPCTAFGAYVNDYNTIEYYLQDIINSQKLPYEVVNCGMVGPENNYQNLFGEKINSEDKVIYLIPYLFSRVKKCFQSDYKGDLSQVYKEVDNPIDCYLDAPSHCNGVINKKIAEFIWKDLKNSLDDNTIKTEKETERKAMQDYFISFDVHKYFQEYVKKYNLEKDENNVVGSIVMNCNPFTKGHRHLIEQACKKVDTLYVFVVEEDKSYFSFEDRYEMVKKNVADLSKVEVVPSGKYIISKNTFAQYFDKDIVTEVNSMHYDVRIFGEVLAQKLGIKYRFVGEEPFDVVTREYNETMKRILPEYGIQVEEVPRLSADGDDIISATKVRKLYKNKDFKELEKYCTSFTVEYLKKLQSC